MKAGGYMGDPLITGEHEIDLGLRKVPLRQPFVKGPLLLCDVLTVAKMPGKALALWVLICHRTALNGGRKATLPSRVLADWGIGKDAKIEALRRLEHAGLIKVERPRGYMLKVSLAT